MTNISVSSFPSVSSTEMYIQPGASSLALIANDTAGLNYSTPFNASIPVNNTIPLNGSVPLNGTIPVNGSLPFNSSIPVMNNTVPVPIPINSSAPFQSLGPLKINDSDSILYRPTLHYTPGHGFMNDPNGLVYNNGTYHMYYQYNPVSAYAGNTTWGHAISDDMLTWKDQPIAIEADEHKGLAFSGSVVIDKHNTTGLAKHGSDLHVAFFTRALLLGLGNNTDSQSQHMAYSYDGGLTFTEYEHNPVIAAQEVDSRDPQVFWHEPSGQWILSIAVARHQKVRFFGSKDLKKWDHLSDFGTSSIAGVDWECPNMVEVPFESLSHASNGNSTSTKKQVLFVSINPGMPLGGSSTQYFIGEFNGSHYIPDDSITRFLDYGKDNYALQVYSGTTGPRPYYTAWLGNWQYAQEIPTGEWRGTMTLPREVSLGYDAFNNTILKQYPVLLDSVRESSIYNVSNTFNNSYLTINIPEHKAVEFNVTMELMPLRSNGSDLSDQDNVIDPTLAPGDPRAFPRLVMQLGNDEDEVVSIGFSAAQDQIYFDRSKLKGFEHPFFAGKFALATSPKSKKVEWQIIYDASSIEVYSMDGLYVGTFQVFPNRLFTWVRFISENGKMNLKSTGSVLKKTIMRNTDM